jgi:hypothetical protein
MGRPTKENLSYFSHDTDMRRDKKIALSIAESPDSMKLYGIYNALLEDIYHEKYFLQFSEEDAILFCQPFNDLTLENFWEILDVLLKRELFDKELYEEHGILTSRSIQERWLKSCERRKQVTMHEDYLLVDVDNFVENELSNNYEGKKVEVHVVSNGKTEDDDNKKEVIVDNNPEEEKETLEEYTLQCEYQWKESQDQPIDFESVVEYWNNVNNAQARMTDPKKTDIRRALREYTGIEIARALYVRAKDEHIGEYKTQWSTFFGQKTLKNMDKWVDKARNVKTKEKKFTDVEDYLENGWFVQRKAKDIAQDSGMPLEDSVFWETKHVENTLLYYPKFDV